MKWLKKVRDLDREQTPKQTPKEEVRKEVLRIEESLGRDAVFSGWSALPFKRTEVAGAMAG